MIDHCEIVDEAGLSRFDVLLIRGKDGSVFRGPGLPRAPVAERRPLRCPATTWLSRGVDCSGRAPWSILIGVSYSWWSRLDTPSTAAWVRAAFASSVGVPRVVVHPNARSDAGGDPFILRDPNRDEDLTQPLGASVASVYVPERSAAGVEASWSRDDGLRLRCFSQSSLDDHRLVAHAITFLARVHGLHFEDEEGEPVDARSVDRVFDASLCQLQHEAGRASLATRLSGKPDDHWVPIQSPVRPLFVSQQLLAWLDAEGVGIPEHLARLVGLHHEPGVCPEKLTVTVDGRAFVGEAFPLGQRTLLARALSDDVVFVHSTDEATRLVVPWEALVEVLEDEVEWFDLRQFVAPSLEAEERARWFRALERVTAARYVVEGP
ncbi:MAG: hypothetical protein MUC96_30700 [Myxococcaceae bacterium]|nr:hypothetical protein [Myxococcaceae bacterium]